MGRKLGRLKIMAGMDEVGFIPEGGENRKLSLKLVSIPQSGTDYNRLLNGQ
jgi:hypothetical protein